MGKRRRSEVNESEGEESPASAAASQAKRARTDKWSFPEELRSSVSGQCKLIDNARSQISFFPDTHLSKVVRFSA